MNERIQELAQQARKNSVRWGVYTEEEFYEKFAKLIVQECAAYLNGAMEVHNQQEQDLMDLAAKQIREHFGVE